MLYTSASFHLETFIEVLILIIQFTGQCLFVCCAAYRLRNGNGEKRLSQAWYGRNVPCLFGLAEGCATCPFLLALSPSRGNSALFSLSLFSARQ